MSAYWAVQIGYAITLVGIVLVALRRYEKQTEAHLRRLLDDLDRLAAQPVGTDAATEEDDPDQPDNLPGSARGESKSPAPAA